jgi:hypothetical protein
MKEMTISYFEANTRNALLFCLLLCGAIAIGGCAVTAAPIDNTPRVGISPVKDHVTVSATPSAVVGSMVPVDISIANGTPEPRLLIPSQVFAINEHGQRIIPMPTSEAIRAATKANTLQAGLRGAAKSGALGAAAGAATGGAIGAVVGTVVAEPLEGLAMGAALGGVVGGAQAAVAGGLQGQAVARQDAETQIPSLALQTSQVHPDFTVNGYVFFPQGNYQGVQVVLLNQETHQTDTIMVPWGGATGDLPAEEPEAAPFGKQQLSTHSYRQGITPHITRQQTSDGSSVQTHIFNPSPSGSNETE